MKKNGLLFFVLLLSVSLCYCFADEEKEKKTYPQTVLEKFFEILDLRNPTAEVGQIFNILSNLDKLKSIKLLEFSDNENVGVIINKLNNNLTIFKRISDKLGPEGGGKRLSEIIADGKLDVTQIDLLDRYKGKTVDDVRNIVSGIEKTINDTMDNLKNCVQDIPLKQIIENVKEYSKSVSSGNQNKAKDIFTKFFLNLGGISKKNLFGNSTIVLETIKYTLFLFDQDSSNLSNPVCYLQLGSVPVDNSDKKIIEKNTFFQILDPHGGIGNLYTYLPRYSPKVLPEKSTLRINTIGQLGVKLIQGIVNESGESEFFLSTYGNLGLNLSLQFGQDDSPERGNIFVEGKFIGSMITKNAAIKYFTGNMKNSMFGYEFDLRVKIPGGRGFIELSMARFYQNYIPGYEYLNDKLVKLSFEINTK